VKRVLLLDPIVRAPDSDPDTVRRLAAGVEGILIRHFLAAIDNGGYFEGDVSKSNKFRDELVENPDPAIEGPGYL
jgi:hypothetical protein